MNIQYIKHNNIDLKKYDYCIENSTQGTIYAMSWYLDVVSPNWDILMADDYNYVMPIPVKKKFFLKYAIQPLLCQQLGIFSLKRLTSGIFSLFIKEIPYSFYKLQFNAGNIFEDYPNLRLRSNYTLDLNQSYEEIKSGYSKNCLRNLKKAEKEKLELVRNTNVEILLKTVVENLRTLLTNNSLHIFLNIFEKAKIHAHAEIYSANKEDTLLSCVLFLKWKNRYYYLLPVSTNEGKQKQSMTFLLDQFIQNNIKNKQFLDFEGSSISSIAEYYRKFGSKPELYPELTSNNLCSKIFLFLIRIKGLKY